MCTDEDTFIFELSFHPVGTSEVGVLVDDVGVWFHDIILINNIMGDADKWKLGRSSHLGRLMFPSLEHL